MKKLVQFIKQNNIYIFFSICIILFLAIADAIFKNEIMNIDVLAYKYIVESLRTPLLTNFMIFVTRFGNATTLILLVLLSYIFIKNKKISLYITENLIFITLINLILKFIVQRIRPEGYRLIIENGYSFPSGHAMVSVAFYGFLIYLIHKYVKVKKMKYLKYVSYTFLIILVFLICISRVYLGVHYASDVVAGAIISTAYLIFFIKVINRFDSLMEVNMKKLINSFKYAFTGIASAFKSERNMKIHISIMFLVIIMGFLFRIKTWEWIVCISWFSVVIGGELFNTSIEIAVNLAMPEKNENAKKSKDISAGGVLVFAIGSAIVGLLIFVPKIIQLF